MKICPTCKKEKSLKDFYTQSDRKNGSSRCKQCFNKYTIQRWIDRKIEAIRLLGGKCSNCGYDKYYGALEFHHKDPSSKDVSWNKLRLRSWPDIRKELDKCEILCANCHREEHHRLHQEDKFS